MYAYNAAHCLPSLRANTEHITYFLLSPGLAVQNVPRSYTIHKTSSRHTTSENISSRTPKCSPAKPPRRPARLLQSFNRTHLDLPPSRFSQVFHRGTPTTHQERPIRQIPPLVSAFNNIPYEPCSYPILSHRPPLHRYSPRKRLASARKHFSPNSN